MYLECASSIEVVGYGAAFEASFGAIREHIPSRNSADKLIKNRGEFFSYFALGIIIFIIDRTLSKLRGM